MLYRPRDFDLGGFFARLLASDRHALRVHWFRAGVVFWVVGVVGMVGAVCLW